MNNFESKTLNNAKQREQILLSEFWDYFTEERMIEIMKNNLRKHTLSKNLSNESVTEALKERLPDAIDKEKKFAQEVIKAFSRWSKETDPVVLWDIDDTMGVINLYSENMKFLFRPSILPLLKFLKEKFPVIKNGVLSSRSKVSEQLQDEKQLKALTPFIDTQYIYSCRNVIVTPEETEKYEAEAENSELISFVNSDYLSRRKIIDGLLQKNLRIKNIDDNAVAKITEENGVWTFFMMPDRLFCENENI